MHAEAQGSSAATALIAGSSAAIAPIASLSAACMLMPSLSAVSALIAPYVLHLGPQVPALAPPWFPHLAKEASLGSDAVDGLLADSSSSELSSGTTGRHSTSLHWAYNLHERSRLF